MRPRPRKQVNYSDPLLAEDEVPAVLQVELKTPPGARLGSDTPDVEVGRHPRDCGVQEDLDAPIARSDARVGATQQASEELETLLVRELDALVLLPLLVRVLDPTVVVDEHELSRAPTIRGTRGLLVRPAQREALDDERGREERDADGGDALPEQLATGTRPAVRLLVVRTLLHPVGNEESLPPVEGEGHTHHVDTPEYFLGRENSSHAELIHDLSPCGG